MPTSPMKNLLYRAALPFMAPTPHKQMTHICTGTELHHQPYYEHLLIRHHVLGASLLLDDGTRQVQVHTSVRTPAHPCTAQTVFRVASITKMASALVTLMCIGDGLFTLDTPVTQLLPEGPHHNVLQGITVRHLLCHTSGLRDIPAMDAALREGRPFDDVLSAEGVRAGRPGEQMAYCNFGFGLIGCLLEHTTGQCIHDLFYQRLFVPLGMRATLDAASLDEGSIMPISRVLPYRAGQDVTVTALGRTALTAPNPERHFGHTAGAMYTDCASLARLLMLIGNGGIIDGQRLVSEAMMHEMTMLQSSTRTRTYGLGLVLLERSGISERRLLGHQGFAYGCVDGAFIEEGTGRMVVFLNGGASEARTGKLGLVNRDVLTWALRKEMPSWT